MNADGAVYLSSSPEEIAERKVSLDRLGIDTDHFEKVFHRLIGLLVQEKIEPL